jgi:hypothetical protein
VERGRAHDGAVNDLGADEDVVVLEPVGGTDVVDVCPFAEGAVGGRTELFEALRKLVEA